jgi:hypothetical protein
MLHRRLPRRIAYLRRNRCSALLGGLLAFILVQPLVRTLRSVRSFSPSERSASWRC